MTVKPYSRQNFASRNYNVINAVPVATYSLSSLAASYNEGDTITITITTTGIVDGTVLYWTTTGTTSAADFSDGVVSGSVTITNNTGTVTRTVLADLVTEGTETFIFNLLTGSVSGTIVASTSSANILDTSISPINYSILFPTTSKTYISLPSSSSLYNLTGDFTVECWVNLINQTAGDWGIFDCRVSGGTAAAWLVNISGGGKAQFYNAGASAGATTIPTNTWTHIAWVRSGAGLRIYVNGVVDLDVPAYGSGSISPGTTAPRLGTKDNGISGYDTQGYISNFRFVNGTAVYTAAFTPPVGPLTAITNTVVLTGKSGTLSDASTNALTLTNSGTLISGENPFGNYSMSFNGTSQYLTVASNAAFGVGTGNFTFECWAFFNSTAATSSFFDLRISGSGGSQIKPTLIFTTGNILTYQTQNTARISSSSALSTGQWYHIALVRNSGTTTLYINGLQTGSTYADTNDFGTASPCYIGTVGDSPGYAYLSGYISNARLVKGTAVYTANFTPPTAALSAITNTSLLTCQYPELFDASTNHFTITNTGTAPASTANPFDNYAYAFNGSTQNLSVPANAAITLSADFTIEFWAFATTTTNAVDQVFNYGNFTCLFYHNGTTWTLEVGNGSSNYFTLAGTASLSAWHHFAITRSGNTYTLWIDGASAATTSNANAPTSNGILYIGSNSSAGQRFTGYITNFRIVKGTAVYTGAFTPTTSPLTAITNTSLLTCKYAELFDASVNNFSITNTGAAPAVATNLFAAPNNLKNYSGKFTGSNILNVPQNAAFSFGTGDFTFEYWYYAQVYGQQNLVDFRGSGGSGEFSTYFNSSDNALKFNDGATDLFSTAIVLNTWTHVALSRNSNVFRAYINGTQLGANTSTATNYTNTTGLNIGAYRTSLAFFNGYISNLRVVKGTGMYTANFTPSVGPLLPVANTVLLTLQSNRIYDAGPNQFSITNTGSTKMAYLSPFST